MSWLPTICRSSLTFIPAVLLVACAQPDPGPASFRRMGPPDLRRPLLTDSQPPAPSPFIRGTALIISLDQTLGYARLEFEGRQVDAYWQTEMAAAQGGFVAQNDPLHPPVGVYSEAQVHNQPLRAQPGDTIAFLGMRTGNSIFLQGIAVLPR